MSEACPRVENPIFARWIYPFVAARGEAQGVAEHRRELLQGLTGRVVEVGAGNGLNFAHYPATVTEVVAMEPERHLRPLAAEAAKDAPVPVRVVDGLAERLPVEDASFDAGVVSLVLCSVRDPSRAVAELFRVIRPGGELRFYEHVLSTSPALARIQRALDGWIWPTIAGGCHAARDTAATIEGGGFEIEQCRRFEFRPCFLLFAVSPQIIGRARRR